MLEVYYIKKNKAQVIQGLQKRKIKNAAFLVEKILSTDQERRATQAALDNTLAQLKKLANQIGHLMKEGKKIEAEAIKLQTNELKAASKTLTHQLRLHEKELKNTLYEIPNIPHREVPNGVCADDNQVVYQPNNLPQIDKNALPHWELAKRYDIIDFELGSKVTGAGFPVYKGKGAKLQRALINFFLDEAQQIGYNEIQPPLIVNQASGYGTGQLPDKEGQMYQLTDEALYLIPTAEVPITNLYRNNILNKDDLPIKNVGYTPCFRREAGSWGSHVRGLNRLHQFDKVEIVQLQLPEKSYEALQAMCQYVQHLLKALVLPYRVVKLCGGDLGFTAALTYDMEVFSVAQGKWLEVSSVSNFETYQANRMKLRYRDENGKIHLLHTLNGSALALPRIMAALLENNQTDAGIYIPEVLRLYTGFDYIG
ncbi:MAG: serine--tRNA ligase [Cytophagales bacterium]|nr:serine--tRNA ligase [Cytophagales bacterium]